MSSSTVQARANHSLISAAVATTRSKGTSTGPRGGVSAPQLNGASRSAWTKSARSRSVDPLIETRALNAPTSRTRVTPEMRIVSGSSPKAGVAIPPGPARKPKRPPTANRRRPRTWAAIVCSAVRVVSVRFSSDMSPRAWGVRDETHLMAWPGQGCEGAGACRRVRRPHRRHSTSTSLLRARRTGSQDARPHENGRWNGDRVSCHSSPRGRRSGTHADAASPACLRPDTPRTPPRTASDPRSGRYGCTAVGSWCRSALGLASLPGPS